jgi:cytochrome c oxidase subunit 3
LTRHPVHLGMAIFLVADSVFFFMLILAFVYFHDLSDGSPTLALPLPSISTACLLGGSFAIFQAGAARPKSRSRSRLWMGVTLILGVCFLVGQARQYTHLFRAGITIGESSFGTTFFTLTGLHALHVLIGILLVTITSTLLMGDESAGEEPIERRQAAVRTAAVRTVAMYWYFLSAVGVAIFLVVYLWRFL